MDEKGAPSPTTLVGSFRDKIIRIRSAKEPKMVEVRSLTEVGDTRVVLFFPAIASARPIEAVKTPVDADYAQYEHRGTIVQTRLVPTNKDQEEEAKEEEEGGGGGGGGGGEERKYSCYSIDLRGDGTYHKVFRGGLQSISPKEYPTEPKPLLALPGLQHFKFGERDPQSASFP